MLTVILLTALQFHSSLFIRVFFSAALSEPSQRQVDWRLILRQTCELSAQNFRVDLPNGVCKLQHQTSIIKPAALNRCHQWVALAISCPVLIRLNAKVALCTSSYSVFAMDLAMLT